MSDDELRNRCVAAGIKVGPLTPSTRSVYLKKLTKITKTPSGQNSSPFPLSEAEIDSLSQEQMEKLDSTQLFHLMEKYNITKVPVTNSNRKLLSKWIFYKINGLEPMDWEDFTQQTDFLDY